jgi:hypothetical protein
MSKLAYEQAAADFRKFLPDLKSPRFTTAKKQTCYEYADAFNTLQNPPWLHKLTQAWEKLYSEPFKGVTVDG